MSKIVKGVTKAITQLISMRKKNILTPQTLNYWTLISCFALIIFSNLGSRTKPDQNSFYCTILHLDLSVLLY